MLTGTLSSTRISEEDYVKAIKEEIKKVVDIQEDLDIDVLVHGEPEVSLCLLLDPKTNYNVLFLTQPCFDNIIEKRHG